MSAESCEEDLTVRSDHVDIIRQLKKTTTMIATTNLSRQIALD